MNISRTITLAVILALTAMAQTALQAQPRQAYSMPRTMSNNYVLILNSHIENVYHPQCYEDEITTYLEEEDIDVYSEHIKYVGLKNTVYIDSIRNRILTQYQIRPRMVVMIGHVTFPIFGKQINDKWQDVPMLYLDINKKPHHIEDVYYNLDRKLPAMDTLNTHILQERFNITGLWDNTEPNKTIDLMCSMMPKLNRIVWIGDNRDNSIMQRQQALQHIREQHPQINMDIISHTYMSTGELLDTITKLDNRTAIIFQNWHNNTDDTAEEYLSSNMYKVLGNFSSAPVFTISDINTQHATNVGGHFTLKQDCSNAAVELVKKIINGKRPSEIAIDNLPSAHNYVNYQVLYEYTINNPTAEIVLPDNVTYMNRPMSFFMQHRGKLLVAFFAALLAVMFYIYRYLMLASSHKIKEDELTKQAKLQKEIELRSLKLQMTLKMADVKPWVMNLDEQMIEIDDVRKHDSLNNSRTYIRKIPQSTMETWMTPEDCSRLKMKLSDIKSGTGDTLTDTFQINDKKGQRWFMIQATVYERKPSGEPKLLIGSSINITDIKKREQELMTAKEAAVAANSVKSVFLANISHEIRTPLNAIVGFSGIIANTDDVNERLEIVPLVEQNCKILLELVDNILELTKIESGDIEPAETDTDINRLIDEIGEKYMPLMTKHVQLVIKKQMDECVAKIDRDIVAKVINNLMSNAVKYTKTGKITLAYSMSHYGYIRFNVRDTGCGIPFEKQCLVFGRFFKLNNFGPGSGLGLTLSKMMVEKMNGRIGLYSEVDKGSEFWFELPLKGVLPQAEEQNPQTTAETNVKANKTTVLIAEDDECEFIILRTLLGSNYTLIHAWNGYEAVDLYKRHKPEIILMDVRMPVMDGYEATIEIRKLSQTVPIIAITGCSYMDSEQIKQYGFTAFQSKPVSRNRLLHLVTSLLGTN